MSAQKDSKNAKSAKNSKNPDSFSIFGCFKKKYTPGKLAPPEDVEMVFNKYAEGGMLNAAKFKDFLNEVQGEKELSLDEAHKILAHQMGLERHMFTKTKDAFTLDGFFHYLLDPAVNLPIQNKVHQDMSLPASHYFVYTGHNSYLTGNQLSSDCSEVPIVEALRKGVRVIELDLWPNKKDETEISVLHGGTMTSPVPFQKCLEAIRDNAFVASEYPVVVTFEDHLTTELQAKAAQMTIKVLGDLLKVPDENEKFAEFPSPDSIKKRILISTKPPAEYKKSKADDKKNEKEDEKKGKEAKGAAVESKTDSDWGDEIPDYVRTKRRAGMDESKVPEEDEEDDDDMDDDDGEVDHVADPEYKKIISIRASKPKGKSLVSALLIDEFVKRVSLSEPQLEKVAEKHPDKLIGFTEKNLLRIYPYGLRVNSSNYNPLVAWSHGAQMVAFNMQGYGRPLWLVQGFFRANGGCGYVKKPDFLFPKRTGIHFEPDKKQAVKMTLKVKAMIGLGWLEKFGKHHFDNFSPPDFYTRVGIAGVQADTIMKKTEPVEDDWYPNWSNEFEFPLTVPELALLRVEVHEYDMTDKDDFGGQTCLPVSELRRGFRSIPLFDKKGAILEGVRLLFHFDLVPASS